MWFILKTDLIQLFPAASGMQRYILVNPNSHQRGGFGNGAGREIKASYRAQYLSSLGVGDAGVAEVTALPLGVEAVALQLPELEGGVECASLDLDGNGVDPDRHALHHFLSKAVLAETREVAQDSTTHLLLFLLTWDL